MSDAPIPVDVGRLEAPIVRNSSEGEPSSTPNSLTTGRKQKTKFGRGFGKLLAVPKKVFKKKQPSSPQNGSTLVSSSSTLNENIPVHEKNGIWELTEPCEDKDGFMDLIAVHGLGGDWKDTWEDDSQNWLQSFLPTKVEKLRVLTFGYSSSVAFSSSTPDLRDLAIKLLNSVNRKRNTPQEKARPIVFICHSLGGIVVKQALITANERQGLHAWFIENVKGIVFMGTPHWGSSYANWGSYFANVLKLTIAPTSNTDLLTSLKEKSRALTEICHQFPERVAKLNILSFYELGICRPLNHRIVERESAILNLINERTAPVDADHTAMCKFSQEDSQKYQEVFGLIRTLIEDIRGNNVTSIGPIQIDQKDSREILESLFDTHVSNRASSDTRVEGTCQWILTNPQFSQWIQSNDDNADDDASNLLWITGAPGTGKSILTTYIVDHLKSQFPNATISSFTFDDGKRPAQILLRSVLHSLLSSNPKLLLHAAKEWHVKGKSFSTHWETLCEIWSQCCSDINCLDTIWVIDALDECEESGRSKFLRQLAIVVNTLQSVGTSSRFKVFFTSRLEKDIQTALSKIQPLRINLDDEVQNLTLDITKVIDKGIKGLTNERLIPSAKANLLKQRLLEESDKTFLWVTLILGLLRIKGLLGSWESIIRDLPAGLDNTYKQLLAKIPKARQPEAKLVLQFIMAATEPLSVREMNLLLRVQKYNLREQNIRSPPYLDTSSLEIQSLCGPFIRIIDTGDGDKHVHFVHKSASEFLLSGSLNRPEPRGNTPQQAYWYSTSSTEAHSEIAKRCIWVLRLIGTSSKGLEKWQGHNDSDFDIFVQTFLKDHEMYAYPAAHWAMHLQISEALMAEDFTPQALQLYKSLGIYTTWSQIFWALQMLPQPHNYSTFHMTAYNGHAKLLDELLEDDHEETTKDNESEIGDTALHIAADRGHPNVIKVLQKHRADFSLRDKAGLTALHRAVKANHLDTVVALLEAGSSVDSRKHDGSTALHLAASEGNCKMLELLVENGSTVQATNHHGKSAADLAFEKGYGKAHQLLQSHQVDHGVTELDQAIIEGNLEEIQELLKAGAVFESTGNRGPSSLHYAARENHPHIVKFLLDKNVGKNIEDENGLTALHLASRRGRSRIVELLLHYGANIDARSKDGSTPLHEAASGGSEDVVQMLLQQDESQIQRLNSTNDEGETAIYCAAALGYHIVVQCLISRGASTALRDRRERTVLHQASGNGHILVLQELFNLDGVEVNCVDLKGASPLTLAARGTTSFHGQVVKLLLEKGADARWPERDLSTPILLAAEAGNIDVIEHLLKKGVNPDERNTMRHTPLGVAASKDHEEAVLVLLNNHAEDVAQNAFKRPPLSWSAEHGHLRAVRRLLQFDAVDVDISGNVNLRTPLSYAAANGHLAVVRCLIQEGNPMIDSRDHDGRTPFSWAAGGGHLEVATLLLENGADQGVRDAQGRAPISWAAIKGSLQLTKEMLELKYYHPHSAITNNGKTLLALASENGHEGVVRFLLSRNIEDLNCNSRAGESPLHLAALKGHEMIVNYLLSIDDIDARSVSKAGFSAFSSAVAGGHFQVAQRLFEFDCSVMDTLTKNEESPLTLASEGGHSDIVAMLLRNGGDPCHQNRLHQTPLFLAAIEGDLVTVNILLGDARVVSTLDKTNKVGMTPLFVAAAKGHLSIVKKLTTEAIASDLGATIKQKDLQSISPLCAAVTNGHSGTVKFLLECERFDPAEHRDDKSTLLIRALCSKDKNTISMLLELNSELDAPDNFQHRTPLLWAASLGDKDTIEFLCSKANVNTKATDIKDRTAIYLAAMGGHEITLKFLLMNSIGDVNSPELDEGLSPLLIAAKNGHLNIVDHLLQHETINVNQQDNLECTAFLWAARMGHELLVQKLAQDPRVQSGLHDSVGRSALSWASEKGHNRIVQLLINLDPAAVHETDVYGSNPLYFAASFGHIHILENLLKYDSLSTVHSGPHRRTPLMRACSEGHFPVVERLCKNKNSTIMDEKDSYGYTALSIAAQCGHEQILSYLLKNGADPNTRATKSGRTPLMEAAMFGRLSVFRALMSWHTTNINLQNDAGRTAFWFAISYRTPGYQEMIYMLLQKNVLTEITDLDGVNYLMLASNSQDPDGKPTIPLAMNEPIMQELLDQGKIDTEARGLPMGQTALMRAVLSGSDATVKLLLDHPTANINPNQADFDNLTPLALAASRGYTPMVQMLLERKATVDCHTIQLRQTPLMFAAASGRTSVVDLLLRFKAKINAVDKDGKTSLCYAAQNGYIRTIQQLLDKGALPDVRSKTGTTALHLAAKKGYVMSVRLLVEGIPAKTRDRQGRTPMSYAAEMRCHNVVQYLLSLSKGTDFETKDAQDNTPLTWAIIGGSVEIVSLLIERGANKDILDRNGRSLVSHAAEKGHLAVLHYLISLRSGIDILDNAGRAPISWAAEEGHLSVVRYLLANNADPNLRDKKGQQPQLYAANNEKKQVVELLRQHNIAAGIRNSPVILRNDANVLWAR